MTGRRGAGVRRRGRRPRSIKRRVIRLVLVPSVVGLVLVMAAAGYLVSQGFYNKAVAQSVRQVSIPAVGALASIQQERRLSITYLTRTSADLQDLLAQRQKTDRLVTQLRAAATAALTSHFGIGPPQQIVTGWTRLTGYLDQLASVRSQVDSRTTTQQTAYNFFNTLLDAATNLFDVQARVVPDVTATQGALAAVELFRTSDQMSRAGSLVDGAFGSGSLSQQNYLEIVHLVETYHSSLDDVAPHVRAAVNQRLESIRTSQPWQDLAAAENAIVLAGPWHGGPPRGLTADWGRWDTLTGQVSNDLLKLTTVQADEVSAQALHTGNVQLLTAVLASLIALGLVLGAIGWALRQSQVLVDRALGVRLARLQADAKTIVGDRLPILMERLRRHEPVDVEAELATTGYGDDEIGRLADVMRQAVLAAVSAAANEARARTAGLTLLRGIARRPQGPLQRALTIISDLQHRIGDEELLAKFFDIHHQLTQTRRFEENLIVLSGGQISRRIPDALPLSRVVLAAFAESHDYQRVTLRGAPDITVAASAVAATIHILAELLDNALTFSEHTVWVMCHRVSHGVAVEIEDAGIGMPSTALRSANELLATAPTPDIAALRDGAQIGLHVVAELAKRANIKVSLRPSAYGGLMAIVLLPDSVLAGSTDGEPADDLAVAVATPPVGSGHHHVPAAAVPAPMTATAATTATRVNGSAAFSPPVPMTAPARGSGGAQVDTHEIRPSWPGQGTGTNGRVDTSADTSRPQLPHRRPQEHLAPGLRTRPETADTEESTPDPTRSAERFAAYQRGRAAGHAAEGQEPSAQN